MSKNLSLKQDLRVPQKWNSYPPKYRKKLEGLRKLIIQTAKTLEGVEELEETLKWGELSYLTKGGSTVRLDWKEKSPEIYSIYFKCTSKLVESFKVVYGDLFEYEKTRAIQFRMDDKIPETELKECIAAALQYHSRKNQTLLGL